MSFKLFDILHNEAMSKIFKQNFWASLKCNIFKVCTQLTFNLELYN